MTHFRLRYEKAGAHVHCRWFAGKGRELTRGKCGDLTMRENEFDDFRVLLASAQWDGDFEIVHEEEVLP